MPEATSGFGMRGRIRADDVAEVRARARIDQVVSQHVALRNAGGGSRKGLCPFHDERTPSFHVNPAKGFYHCFGCGEGGDVIDFIRKVEHLGFTEAVERLASQAGIILRYEDVDPAQRAAREKDQARRARLLSAHSLAEAYFQQGLLTAEADLGRTFLTERGFDRAAAARFGVGFAPRGWDGLSTKLRGAGFSTDEMLQSGLILQGSRGLVDRFRGRLIWPIRELSGDTVGFGARKLFDDDNGPKYLNSPETALFHKSTLLYGADLARTAIVKSQQVVIVEGYTDVMAAHLAGITTAVATCGTAFGKEHVSVLRRLLLDEDSMSGAVVFCFDGDEAGQRAALRAFESEDRFVTQTFVAVQPEGLDPNELRLRDGDEGVRELIAHKVPLVEFVVRASLAKFDLNIAEGRVGALRAAAPLVGRIKDPALRPEYARLLAGWLGMPEAAVRDEIGRAGRSGKAPTTSFNVIGRGTPSPSNAGPDDAAAAGEQVLRLPEPDGRTPEARLEREALKVALQHPDLAAARFDVLGPDTFSQAVYRMLHHALISVGGCTAGLPAGPDGPDPGRPSRWASALLAAIPAAVAAQGQALVTALAVEPLQVATADGIGQYVDGVLDGLAESLTRRRVAVLREQLQRLDPAADAATYAEVFTALIAAEQDRRRLS